MQRGPVLQQPELAVAGLRNLRDAEEAADGDGIRLLDDAVVHEEDGGDPRRAISSCKSFRYLLTDPRRSDIVHSDPWLAGDRMQFDQLKRRDFITLLGLVGPMVILTGDRAFLASL